jgi:hypothetical protein
MGGYNVIFAVGQGRSIFDIHPGGLNGSGGIGQQKGKGVVIDEKPFPMGSFSQNGEITP